MTQASLRRAQSDLARERQSAREALERAAEAERDAALARAEATHGAALSMLSSELRGHVEAQGSQVITPFPAPCAPRACLSASLDSRHLFHDTSFISQTAEMAASVRTLASLIGDGQNGGGAGGGTPRELAEAFASEQGSLVAAVREHGHSGCLGGGGEGCLYQPLRWPLEAPPHWLPSMLQPHRSRRASCMTLQVHAMRADASLRPANEQLGAVLVEERAFLGGWTGRLRGQSARVLLAARTLQTGDPSGPTTTSGQLSAADVQVILPPPPPPLHTPHSLPAASNSSH